MTPEQRRALARAAKAVGTATAKRDTLIVAAHDAGVSAREIARVTGLTHPGIAKIVARARR